MIDVNEYLERTEEIRFPDKTIHALEPTHNMYLAALQHEGTDEGVEFINYQLEALIVMLNRNKEKVEIEKKELEELPRGFIVATYRTLMMMCNRAINDPN